MPVLIDHELKEFTPHKDKGFPVTYYQDELASLPGFAGPFHWHDDFEIALAESAEIEYQIGENHVILEKGDVIFVNGNVMHRIRQKSHGKPDALPNIVFSAAAVAAETSPVYRKYIQPVYMDGGLPCIVFRRSSEEGRDVCRCADSVLRAMRERGACYEMTVQRELIHIFELISRRFEEWPRTETERIAMQTQIRVQKMLAYIHHHFRESITLDEIASAADISRSAAARCFRAYMDCSPVEALMRHRLQRARKMLGDTEKTIDEIAAECGFHSAGYFSRQFKRAYQMTPGRFRQSLGK